MDCPFCGVGTESDGLAHHLRYSPECREIGLSGAGQDTEVTNR